MTGARTMFSLAKDYSSERRALVESSRWRAITSPPLPCSPTNTGIVGLPTVSSELGPGAGQTGQPVLLGSAPGCPSPVREVSDAARSRHRVSPDRDLCRFTPAASPAHIFRAGGLRPSAAAGADSKGGLRPATYATLFGLIPATGLRRSEALDLHCGDVDLAGAVDGSKHEVPQVKACAHTRHRRRRVAALSRGSGASRCALQGLPLPVLNGRFHYEAEDQ